MSNLADSVVGKALVTLMIAPSHGALIAIYLGTYQVSGIFFLFILHIILCGLWRTGRLWAQDAFPNSTIGYTSLVLDRSV